MSIDDVYTFWNSRPCNSRHSDKPTDTAEYFDSVSAKRYTSEPHIIDFMNAKYYRGKRVLELGSGVGTDAVQFARAGALVTCVDLTPNGIELCRKNFETHGLTGTFYVGNIEELDAFLPQQKFDLIYSFGVIHHTPTPTNVTKQLRTYLAPGGEVKMMVYSKISYKLFWILHETEWKLSRAKDQIQKYSEAQTGCPVTFTYTFDEAIELLGSGFEIRSIHKDHIFMFDISEYVKGKFVRDPAFIDSDPVFVDQLKKELGWHTLIHAVFLG